VKVRANMVKAETSFLEAVLESFLEAILESGT